MKLMNNMINPQILFVLLLGIVAFSSFAFAAQDDPVGNAFVGCLLKLDPSISSVVYTPRNTQFLTVLDFLIQNSRFENPQTPKPKAVLRPTNESQIQAAIYCAKRNHLEMRIRSGGHDFEGSSYISQLPFFVLDMFNFQSLSVDSETKTAWVGVGLSLGQVYYGINAANDTLAFPAGTFPTVGAGGHISGGGYGRLVRKHGLAADNVLDARIIDANGRILDRKSMGEELFWGIRGGVGSNFGVILSFKLRLVDVPKTVAVSRIIRTPDQNAVQLVYKWQQIARKLPVDLTLDLEFRRIVSTQTGNITSYAEFLTAHLGPVDELVSIFNQFFPELNMTKDDCQEMPFINSYAFLIDQTPTSVKDFLTTRGSPLGKPYFKWKVDLPQDPIPPEGIAKIFDELEKVPPFSTQLGWTVFGGGIMDEIPESEIPFPHRGKLMIMRHIVYWNGNDSSSVVQSRIDWVRGISEIVGKYVPTNPRAQYADYRDHDLGVNNVFGRTSIQQARKWGVPYFKNNFDRLVRLKTLVDPTNFFKFEQSFPPLHQY